MLILLGFNLLLLIPNVTILRFYTAYSCIISLASMLSWFKPLHLASFAIEFQKFVLRTLELIAMTNKTVQLRVWYINDERENKFI